MDNLVVKKRIIKFIVPLVFLIPLALWIIYNYHKIDFTPFRNFSLIGIISLLLLLFLYLYFGILSYKIIFNNLKFKVSTLKLYIVNAASGTSNYLGPIKLNFPILIHLFKVIFKIPYETGASCRIVTFVIDTIVIFIFAIIGVFIVFKEALKIGYYNYLIVILIFIMLICFVFIPFKIKKREGKKIFDKIINFFSQIKIKINEINIITIMLLFIISFIKRIIFSIASFLIIFELHYSISFIKLLFGESISIFVGMISFMPMGLGSKDITLIAMSNYLNCPENAIFLLSISSRILWTLIPLIIGIISFYYLIYRYGKDLIKFKRADNE